MLDSSCGTHQMTSPPSLEFAFISLAAPSSTSLRRPVMYTLAPFS
jgi:hypothetical protein